MTIEKPGVAKEKPGAAKEKPVVAKEVATDPSAIGFDPSAIGFEPSAIGFDPTEIACDRSAARSTSSPTAVLLFRGGGAAVYHIERRRPLRLESLPFVLDAAHESIRVMGLFTADPSS